MSKLQLYITISHKGFRNQAEINATEKVRQHVCDLSAAVEGIRYNPREKNIFYLLKYTGQGVFITVLRTIPSNAPDHLASWIFIPCDIRISNEEIDDVVKSVVEVVSKSKITSEGFNALRDIFDHNYPTLDNAGATVGNTGSLYAHRFFGGNSGYSLSDYIGIHRYQTAYLNFAGVILADKTRVEGISGTDLTTMPLEQMVNIFPPKADNRPYHPLIFGQPFTHPFLVPLMGTVEIVWESSSAVDIRQSIMISKPNMRPDNISLASSRNVAGRHKPLDKIPTHEDTGKDSTPATGTPATDASDTPAADAGHPAPAKPRNEPRFDHKPEQRSLNFDRLHTYKFEIPAKSADISGMIHFEIQTRSNLEGSPIDGYELCDSIQEGASRSNHLIYAPNESKLKTTAWGVAGLVAGIILTLICTSSFGSRSNKAQTVTETTEADSTLILQNASDTLALTGGAAAGAPDAISAVDASFDKAIAYLDANDKWDKNVLESYPDLRGLYDDMNNMNRERIVNYWAVKLKDSRKFERIADHSKKSLNLRKKPLTRGKNGHYNPDNDLTISVRSWLNHVDP